MRPRSYWDVVVHHFPLAAISGTALFLPYVAARQDLPLIPCTFLNLTGLPCPFCGFTRAFWSIATGAWGKALVECPLAFGIYLFVAGLFVWNASAMVLRVVLLPGPRFHTPPGRSARIAGIVCGLFLLNWAYRLIMGLT
jgi:hypothetical protein